MDEIKLAADTSLLADQINKMQKALVQRTDLISTERRQLLTLLEGCIEVDGIQDTNAGRTIIVRLKLSDQLARFVASLL